MGAVDYINLIVKNAASGQANQGSFGGSVRTPASNQSAGGSTSASKPVVTIKSVAPIRNFKKENFQDVYDFWTEIAPQIKAREEGEKYLPWRFQRIFKNLMKTPVSYAKLDDKTSGRAKEMKGSPNGNAIELNNTPGVAKKSTLAHEIRHVYERLMERMGSAFPKKSKDILQKVYGFDGVDINPDKPGYSEKWGPEEMFTTNKEHQFLAYLDLKKSLGKKPTAAEYFKYINGLSADDLIKMRRRLANGYQQIADKNMSDDAIRRNIELYRKALMEVSKLGFPANGYGFSGNPAYA